MLLLLLVTLSCAQTSKKKTPLPFAILETQVNKCLSYKKEVLENTSLNKFELKAGFKDEKEQFITGILSFCDEERIKKFQYSYDQISRCDLGFSELVFFQSVIQKIRKRDWPITEELEAKRIVKEYIMYYSTTKNHPLLDRLIALSVLDEMSVYSVIPFDLHSQIKQIILESQDFILNLEKSLTSKNISCENLEGLRKEIFYSQEIGRKIKGLIKKWD